VVPHGAVDKIFINTTGIEIVEYRGISAFGLKKGMSVFSCRFGLKEGCLFYELGCQAPYTIHMGVVTK